MEELKDIKIVEQIIKQKTGKASEEDGIFSRVCNFCGENTKSLLLDIIKSF